MLFNYYLEVTMVLDRLMNIFEKKHRPSHIGIIINGNVNYAKKNNKTIKETYQLSYENIFRTIRDQVKFGIPIITFNVLSQKALDKEYYPIILEELIYFFEKVTQIDLFDKYQIRISIFGKWYELPGIAVEKIKKAMDKTKYYDGYYVNFCINYDGHEEILDACRIISRKIQANKLEVEQVTAETIKENIYNSFIPPDLIIKTGKNKKLKGFLLWDSEKSKIYFSDKYWPDFDRKEFIKAMTEN